MFVTSSSVSALQYTPVVLCSRLLAKCTRLFCYFAKTYGSNRRRRVGWDRQLVLSPDGDRHKAMRKLVARFVGTRSAIAALSSVQETEARWFVRKMSESPAKVLSHIRLYVCVRRVLDDTQYVLMFILLFDSATSAVFLKSAHGYSIERDRPDPLISLIETAASEFYLAAAPGAWLVDSIPWRKCFHLVLMHRRLSYPLKVKKLPEWMPGTGFKKAAARFRDTNMKQVYVPIDIVKKQLVLYPSPSLTFPGRRLIKMAFFRLKARRKIVLLHRCSRAI
jgi:hypothetical protein